MQSLPFRLLLTRLARPEFWNAGVCIQIVKHHLDVHVTANILMADAKNVGEQTRAFFKFYQCNDIGHAFCESWPVDTVKRDKAEYLSAS